MTPTILGYIASLFTEFYPFNTAFLWASCLWNFSFQLFFEIFFIFLLELLHGGGHHMGPLYPSLLQWFGLNDIYYFVSFDHAFYRAKIHLQCMDAYQLCALRW